MPHCFNTLFRRILLLLVLILPATEILAQTPDLYRGSEQPVRRFSFSALYQRFDDNDLRVDQTSFPFSAFFPVGQRMSLALLATPSTSGGDNVTTLNSVNDLQLAASYFQPISNSSLVLSLSANLPSGKSELNAEELETSVLISQPLFNFRAPSTGMGFNLYPGATLAIPMGNTVALGLGAAYQYRGEYTPTLGGQPYSPGDEILLTGGIDVRVNQAASLSGDFTYTLYGSDKVDTTVVFTSGNRAMATLQYLQFFGFNQLRILGVYRSKGKSELSGLTAQTIPNQFSAYISYRYHVGRQSALGIFAQGRFYSTIDTCVNAADPVCESRSLFDIGVTPEWVFNPSLSLITRAMFTVGSFTGIEAGAGLAYSF